MLLETEKESVCINQIIGQKKDEFVVEGDIIVNDIKPDVLNIVSTSGVPCVYKKETIDGKVRIDGTVNTYIIYLPDDENSSVRSLNAVLDFTKILDIEKCKAGMTTNVNIKIKKIDVQIINGRKLNVKAILEADVKVFDNENINIISNMNDIDNIQLLNSNKKINSLVGKGSTSVYAKDTISVEAEDEIAEIMQAGLKIVDKDIKLSYNKVLAKSEADISIMYLTEDSRIKSIDTKIPVMGFIDIESIGEESICDVNYMIKNLVIKPNNGDIHSIYVEAEIEISCFAYEEKTIDLIEDLYSISSDIKFTQKQISVMAEKQNLKDKYIVKENIEIAEIGNNQLYNVKVNPNISNYKAMNGKIVYEGEIRLEFIYQANNGINSREIELPLKFDIVSDSIDEKCMVDTCIDSLREDFIVQGEGKIEINIELEFNLNINKNETLNIIDKIEEEETREKNIYSMVIYFVKQGDTLWEIAKKFKSTVDDIARVNEIEDPNNIYIGEQLYIPKFIKKGIAV